MKLLAISLLCLVAVGKSDTGPAKVSVGLTQERLTVSQNTKYVNVTISVLTGTLKHNVILSCRTEDGTAHAFIDYIPVDTVITLWPQMSRFGLTIALQPFIRGKEFYVQLSHLTQADDVVISTSSLTIMVEKRLDKRDAVSDVNNYYMMIIAAGNKSNTTNGNISTGTKVAVVFLVLTFLAFWAICCYCCCCMYCLLKCIVH